MDGVVVRDEGDRTPGGGVAAAIPTDTVVGERPGTAARAEHGFAGRVVGVEAAVEVP